MYAILIVVIDMDINLIKGVGDKSIELLSKMNLLTVNNAIVLNAVIIIVLYTLSIYPFYVLQPKEKGDWNESY